MRDFGRDELAAGQGATTPPRRSGPVETAWGESALEERFERYHPDMETMHRARPYEALLDQELCQIS